MHTLPSWQRLERHGHPIYILPERPDWLVANKAADLLLRELLAAGEVNGAVCRLRDRGHQIGPGTIFELERLAGLVTGEPPAPYRGRREHLRLEQLKECWFHVTDTCNLACRHCLFGASPAKIRTLDRGLLARGLTEAKDLGCRVFYFTGGEPLLYPGLYDLLGQLLDDCPEARAVVLTNGLLLEKHLDRIRQLPTDRLHLQVSLDGLEESNDGLRGRGSFQGTLAGLRALNRAGIKATLSMAVNRDNYADLTGLVALAADFGLAGIHLLWHFTRGKGGSLRFATPADLLPQLMRARETAKAAGVVIDNLEVLKKQIFAAPGTIHDLSNTGWESLAMGGDGIIYPSPALVYADDLACGALADGLEAVWRHSPVLEEIRAATLIDDPGAGSQPLRFLIGGNDIDHSYLAAGKWVGHDPYRELYNELALWLIADRAAHYAAAAGDGPPEILLRMGDVRAVCGEGVGPVNLTHCNCVVSLAGDQGHRPVREFYARAALTANEEIVNPFAAGHRRAEFIPLEARRKSYGCGSPVEDAAPALGEVVVDLGSGSGVECFLAAEAVGGEGKVFGIDMTDEMLALAESSRPAVAARLGYDNVTFKKGFLERIPLADESAQVVISNCVINLSPDKRAVFREIFRILAPGGRLVVSDIVTDQAVPLAVKNSEKMRGECLGGALLQEELLAMLRTAGFEAIRLIKRFPYRFEQGMWFHSLTFGVMKPAAAVAGRAEVEVIYRGPHGAIYTEEGILLLKGRRTPVSPAVAARLDDAFFVLDRQGKVTNLDMQNGCNCGNDDQGNRPATNIVPLVSLRPLGESSGRGGCCGPIAGHGPAAAILPMSRAKVVPLPRPEIADRNRFRSGCMACGAEIVYHPDSRPAACYYCGAAKTVNALCAAGHYICDDCHQQDGLSAIRIICAETREQDMLTLLKKIRCHPAIAMHGPEHHAMVPGIILATFRNRGGGIERETILAGIERGARVPGGVCGFWGNCGAATGTGIAFSLLLEATPLTPHRRQQAQQVTARVLHRVAAIKGARCCQRETVAALKEAAAISRELLEVNLLAEEDVVCRQSGANRECIRKQCPLWKG